MPGQVDIIRVTMGKERPLYGDRRYVVMVATPQGTRVVHTVARDFPMALDNVAKYLGVDPASIGPHRAG